MFESSLIVLLLSAYILSTPILAICEMAELTYIEGNKANES